MLCAAPLGRSADRAGAANAAPAKRTVAAKSSLIRIACSCWDADNPDPNGDGSTEYDLTVIHDPFTVTLDPISSNNLIRRSVDTQVPADTISGAGACPLLGPLRDNGGPTRTHALLSGSIAIDNGNNNIGASQDQRGTTDDPGPPYPYPREADGAADIGAFEYQPADTIFNASLEACTPIP